MPPQRPCQRLLRHSGGSSLALTAPRRPCHRLLRHSGGSSLQMLRGALAGGFCGILAAFLDVFSWLGFLVASDRHVMLFGSRGCDTPRFHRPMLVSFLRYASCSVGTGAPTVYCAGREFAPRRMLTTPQFGTAGICAHVVASPR